MKKLYFGRPISVYGRDTEDKLRQIIMRHFPAWVIEDPNQQHHQDGYRIWKSRTGNGMNYYFNEVLPKCAGGIFLPFRDGKLGAGVYGECEYLHEKMGVPVWEISHDGVISFVIDWASMKKRALTINETRSRVYGIDGSILVY